MRQPVKRTRSKTPTEGAYGFLIFVLSIRAEIVYPLQTPSLLRSTGTEIGWGWGNPIITIGVIPRYVSRPKGSRRPPKVASRLGQDLPRPRARLGRSHHRHFLLVLRGLRRLPSPPPSSVTCPSKRAAISAAAAASAAPTTSSAPADSAASTASAASAASTASAASAARSMASVFRTSFSSLCETLGGRTAKTFSMSFVVTRLEPFLRGGYGTSPAR